MKRVERRVAVACVLCGVSLLLGLGSCAARVPVTVSADSAASDPSDPSAPTATPSDLEYARDIGDCDETEAGTPSAYDFDEPDAAPSDGCRPKRAHAVR